MKTIYALTLVFGTWDDCSQYAFEQGYYEDERVKVTCLGVELPMDPPTPTLGGTVGSGLAPITSIRPNLRPEGLAD